MAKFRPKKVSEKTNSQQKRGLWYFAKLYIMRYASFKQVYAWTKELPPIRRRLVVIYLNLFFGISLIGIIIFGILALGKLADYIRISSYPDDPMFSKNLIGMHFHHRKNIMPIRDVLSSRKGSVELIYSKPSDLDDIGTARKLMEEAKKYGWKNVKTSDDPNKVTTFSARKKLIIAHFISAYLSLVVEWR